ncbi:NPR1 [Branchiostoma lanceolatum]|uniref:guanylate cyclase n=1 Tax=Branchiostoma lanceolatum TaxID=7740 RepID=A0A8J9ZNX4_BRALA|nr:NPR1 [Branchiostoma lanceolatum]
MRSAARLVVVVVLFVSTVLSEEFKVLLMMPTYKMPFSGQRVGAAAHIALERVNSGELGILQGHRLTYDYIDTDCEGVEGTGRMVEAQRRGNYSAFIGPMCSWVCTHCARLAAYWNIPVVNPMCSAEEFVDKTEFRTLTRVFGPFIKMGGFFAEICAHFGWQRFALIVHKAPVWTSPMGAIRHIAGLRNMTVATYQEIGHGGEDLADVMRQTAAVSRVIFIAARGETVRTMMLHAYDQGLTNGEFVFFCVEFFRQPQMFGTFDWKTGDGRDGDAKMAFEALFILSLYRPDTAEYATFGDEVIRRSLSDFGFTYPPEEEGNITIDSNGDRDSDYMLYDMQDVITGTFQVVANFFGERKVYDQVPGVAIKWPAGSNSPPRDAPECGFKGEFCVTELRESDPMVYVGSSFSSLVVALVVLVIIMYRKYRLEAEVASMQWKVKPEDVVFAKGHANSLSRASTRATGRSLATIYSGFSVSTTDDEQQIFTKTCTYKGNVVALKWVEPKKAHLNKTLLLELKQLRDLTHPNVTMFVGACLEPATSNCFILTEYCPRGSLQDILENDSLTLDWMFRFSLMLDIVKGMAFIHNSFLKSHGQLCSSNCVVDSRFVLKVTDFGLMSLRKRSTDKTHAYYTKLLYRAPELLRGSVPARGSQKGDVYSFAIIVQEIVFRCGTFYRRDGCLLPEDMIKRVQHSEEPPYRPTVREDACPQNVSSLMEKCWSEDPDERPDFHSLRGVVKKLSPSSQSENILDNLLSRMEQYANNLESLVEERTGQYMDEKKKAEDLLHQLLPRTVADQLTRGQRVEAEAFDCVTIYFSDIVGFTSLSAQSSPMQVVALLNDLYTTFDAIIDNYGVYKVETIGDAYMVVSGLPLRNGNLHAREVARMSLALLAAVSSFKIRHRPQDQLRLRIGIHSGPCVAGVVGLKMPRYCLFGDTVNTASRMESTGLPLRIHVSVPTVTLLSTYGGFVNEFRGQVEMKGKGLVPTYWLLREEKCSTRDIL